MWEAKGKGHCVVQKLPDFELSPPQGHPAAPAPTMEPKPWADLGVLPHRGGPEGETQMGIKRRNMSSSMP